jgi:hypothetical protein
MRDQIFGSTEHHHWASDRCTIVLVRAIHILVSTVPPFTRLNFELDQRILDHQGEPPPTNHPTSL